MNQQPAIPVLETLPLARGLNAAELGQFARILKAQQFSTGRLVLEQGQTDQALWMLLEGTCEVIKYYDHSPSETVVLADLPPQSHFGEMSFFSPAPHSASVRAKTDVKLFRLDRADYDQLIHDGVSAGYKVACNVLQSMADRLRRMDDWVARLATHHEANGQPEAAKKRAEWLVFRDKLFNDWNL